MLYTYSIEKLTGLQGIIINNIESNEKEVHIYCELERKPYKCPNCGCVTDCVHDYRVQVIKDIPSFGKFVYIHLRKRRYRCKCGKGLLKIIIFLLNTKDTQQDLSYI